MAGSIWSSSCARRSKPSTARRSRPDLRVSRSEPHNVAPGQHSGAGLVETMFRMLFRASTQISSCSSSGMRGHKFREYPKETITQHFEGNFRSSRFPRHAGREGVGPAVPPHGRRSQIRDRRFAAAWRRGNAVDPTHHSLVRCIRELRDRTPTFGDHPGLASLPVASESCPGLDGPSPAVPRRGLATTRLQDQTRARSYSA